MIKSALESLAAQLPVRAEVEKVWSELHKPQKIADQPSTYALLKPERIRLQNVAFDDPGILTVRVALDGKCVTEITEKPPNAPQPTPLPPLLQEAAISPEFHVVVPVALNLAEVNKEIQSHQNPIALKLDDDSSVEIRDLSLYAKRGLLYARMSIHGENKLLHVIVDGEIFMQGRPQYDDVRQRLTVTDVGFEAKTKSTLQNMAAWLLNDFICKKIETLLVLDVGAQTEKLKKDVNDRFAAVQINPGVRFRSTLTKLKVTGIEATDSRLIVGFDLAGEVKCDISPTAKK